MIESPAPTARSMRTPGKSRRRGIRPMGLRGRILLTFGLGSLALSLFWRWQHLVSPVQIWSTNEQLALLTKRIPTLLVSQLISVQIPPPSKPCSKDLEPIVHSSFFEELGREMTRVFRLLSSHLHYSMPSYKDVNQQQCELKLKTN